MKLMLYDAYGGVSVAKLKGPLYIVGVFLPKGALLVEAILEIYKYELVFKSEFCAVWKTKVIQK
jgi:hypothetical protein